MSVTITATGSFLGTNIVDNKHLFHKISNFEVERARETVRKKGGKVDGVSPEELFDQWVRQVCGVEKRVFFTEDQKTDPQGPEQLNEYMGYKAGKQALENGGIDPQTIEHVIYCSYTPNQLMPNPACLSAHFLGCKGASAMHINTACSSFLDGLGLAYMLIKSGEYKKILVIASDLMSGNIDFGDVTTAILFGDGASAAVLEKTEDSSQGVLGFSSMTDYNKDMISMDYGKPIKMGGGPLVQRNAVHAMTSSLEKALEKGGLTMKDVKWLIPHQANLRIIQRLADKLEIPYERTVQSVVFTANVSCAAIGIGLDLAFRNKLPGIHFQKGDVLGLTTVGGGYTLAGMAYRV